MIKNLVVGVSFLVAPLVYVPSVNAAEINQAVAKAYNDGLVRCSNPACAKYLYACFRTYSATTLTEFLICGTQASRLNGDQLVVADPTEST